MDPTGRASLVLRLPPVAYSCPFTLFRRFPFLGLPIPGRGCQQVDFQLAVLLPIEYAKTYRRLLCRVIGTQVVFAVENDDGRKLAEQVIHHSALAVNWRIV
jgi:hypothetical protein